MKLTARLVEKPWGRTDIPPAFGDMHGGKIGEIWYADDAAQPLPILIKWLFTSEKLSIQVHPNQAQAAARGLISGKDECWVIIAAEPGAILGIGTKRPLSSDELRAASLSGDIEQLMEWKPVTAGDYFYIPAGTIHAIGAGITLVEVQQYADVTYRLYDYGRLDKGLPRALHLDDGVAVAMPHPYKDARSGHLAGHLAGTGCLVDGPYFRLDHIMASNDIRVPPADQQRWVIPLNGRALVGQDGLTEGECALAAPHDAIIIGKGASVLVAQTHVIPL